MRRKKKGGMCTDCHFWFGLDDMPVLDLRHNGDVSRSVSLQADNNILAQRVESMCFVRRAGGGTGLKRLQTKWVGMRRDMLRRLTSPKP